MPATLICRIRNTSASRPTPCPISKKFWCSTSKFELHIFGAGVRALSNTQLDRRRQIQPKRAAAARRGLQPHFTPHALDGFLHDGQADTRPVVLGAESQKDFENLLVSFRGNANSVVLHA